MALSTPMPLTFGLIAALEREIRDFLKQVGGGRRLSGPRPAWHFYLGDWSGIVAVSGTGAAAAQQTALAMIATQSPKLLLSLGYGGAVGSDLEPGTVVLGQEYWHYNPAEPTLELVRPPWPPVPLASLVAGLQAVIPAAAGALVTTPRIISKRIEAGPVLGLPTPVLDLETAAVAAVARAQGLPFLGVRAITDPGGEEIPDFLANLVPAGSRGTVKTLWNPILKDPRRVVCLARLWRRARLASRRLALALITLLPRLGPAISNQAAPTPLSSLT